VNVANGLDGLSGRSSQCGYFPAFRILLDTGLICCVATNGMERAKTGLARSWDCLLSDVNCWKPISELAIQQFAQVRAKREPSGMKTFNRHLAIGVHIALFLSVSPIARADGIDISGDATLDFFGEEILDQSGNVVGYNYTYLSAEVNVPGISVVRPISLRGSALGPAVFWRDTSNWDSITLALNRAWEPTAYFVNGIFGTFSLNTTIGAVDSLMNGGPTEYTISVPFMEITSPQMPGWGGVELSTGITFKYDVTIQSGGNVIMDQAARLEKLTVTAGATLMGDPRMEIMTDLYSHGLFAHSQGTVHGNYYNTSLDSTVSGLMVQGNLVNSGTLSLLGYLSIGGGNNTGTLRLLGSSFQPPAAFSNPGTISVEGGTLSGSSGFQNAGTVTMTNGSLLNLGNAGLAVVTNGTVSSGVNQGSFDFRSGTLSGTYTNQGTMDMASGGSVGMATSTLENFGLVRHSTTNALVMGTGSWPYTTVLNNRTGGTYKLQGDGQIAQGNNGWFYNWGTLWKSSGVNTGRVDAYFYNYGNVQADSGVLMLRLWGNDGGAYQAASGARIWMDGNGQMANGLTATGAGVIELGAGNLYAQNNTNAWITTNSHLLISGGSLNGDNRVFNYGALAMSAGQMNGVVNVGTAVVTNGTVSSGVNQGSFDFRSGTLSGTYTNQGTMDMASGGSVGMATSTLENFGLVRHSTTNALVMGTGSWPYTTVLNNRTGGTYKLQGDGQIAQGNNGWFYNWGTLWKSSGVNTGRVDAYFYNYGNVQADSGVLMLSGFQENQGGKWSLAGGSISASSTMPFQNCTISGFGKFLSPVNFTGLTQFNPTNSGLVFSSGATFASTTTNHFLLTASTGSQSPSVVQVRGTATLAGKIQLDFAPDFFPATNVSYAFMSNAIVSGAFETNVVGVGRAAGMQFQLSTSGNYQTLKVVALGTNYASWVASRFSASQRTDGVSATPGADPDGDGRSNLLEYAQGTDPNTPDTQAAFRASIESGQFQIQYRRRKTASDLNFVLLGAGSATETWSPVAGGEFSALASQPTESSDIEWATLQANQPIANSTNRYYRLRVDYSGW
jgi:hypothetical protein